MVMTKGLHKGLTKSRTFAAPRRSAMSWRRVSLSKVINLKSATAAMHTPLPQRVTNRRGTSPAGRPKYSQQRTRLTPAVRAVGGSQTAILRRDILPRA